jgi:GNAT superfamily N-acetyltransferase
MRSNDPQVVWHTSAWTFLSTARAHLEAAPLVNQLPLGSALQALADPARFHEVLGATVHAPDGTCIGASLQTLPWPVGLSRMPVDAARALGEAWRPRFGALEAALGETDTVLAFGGEGTTVVEHMGLHALHAVVPLPRAEGRKRLAGVEDADCLQQWLEAFHAEAVPDDPSPGPGAGARAANAGRFHLWLDAEDRPVTFAAFGREVGGYVSVGPVYTPPTARGRGFATSLVAEMSAEALAQGRRGCTLFTDLANPISNRIYARIGYVQIGQITRVALPKDSQPAGGG